LTTRDALAAFDAHQDAMQQLSASLFGSDEAREGMTAFLQRRPPAWAAEASSA
jgi:enoyl-CoA hydratase